MDRPAVTNADTVAACDAMRVVREGDKSVVPTQIIIAAVAEVFAERRVAVLDDAIKALQGKGNFAGVAVLKKLRAAEGGAL